MKLSLMLIAIGVQGYGNEMNFLNDFLTEVERDLKSQMKFWRKLNPTKRRSKIVPCFTYNAPSFNSERCYNMRTDADAARRQQQARRTDSNQFRYRRHFKN